MEGKANKYKREEKGKKSEKKYNGFEVGIGRIVSVWYRIYNERVEN